jgi:hypothetical protein
MKNISEPIPELGNRTWDELEVVKHSDGHLLFKDQIRRINEKGKLETVDVRVRIVRALQLGEARTECRALFSRLKLDEEKDKSMFEEFEQICILAHAIREKNAPYGQLETAEDLASKYDESSLHDILGRIQALRTIIDPRDSVLTEDDLWRKTHAVASRGHLGPLTDIAGHEQPSCIVFMASQAMNSQKGRAWLQSLETSTPARSAATNS